MRPNQPPETLPSSMYGDRREPAPIRELAHEQQSQTPAAEEGLRATHPQFEKPSVFPNDRLGEINFADAKVVGSSTAGSARTLKVEVPGGTTLELKFEDGKFLVQTGLSPTVHTATAAQAAQLRSLLANTKPGDFQYAMGGLV